MNIVQSISAREKGLKYVQGYDIALLRLKCCYEDIYQGVSANVDAADYHPRPQTLACEFSSTPGYEQIIALANEDGKIALQDTSIRNGSQDPLEGTQAHNNAIYDIAWMPEELKLITASSERTACLWDVASSSITKLQTFCGHTHTIKSAVFRYQDKAVFATGARDGAIMIWDIRANHSGQPKPDNSIFNAHEIRVPQGVKQRRASSQSSKCNLAQSVTALAFQDDYSLLSCSAGDGFIKVWDLRKNYTIHKKEPIAKYVLNYGGKSNTYNGFTSLLVCPAGITLYASCVDKKIYTYNLSSYNPTPVAEYYGHGSDNKVLSFFVKACLSPDGEYLASGSNDETAYIWRTRNPGTPLITLSGHRDEVTCIAWCTAGETKIITCSDDSYHRIWRVRPELNGENEDINIYGWAERYQQTNLASSHLSDSSTPRSTTTDFYHSGCSGSSKKTHSRLSSHIWSIEKCKSILSPIQENLESSPKRSTFDNRAARKLYFTPSRNNKAVESSSPSQSINYESDDTMASSSSEQNVVMTTTFSPTLGLPNFVIDGTAPHLLENSPQKSKENIDWLTKIRRRKSAERNGNRQIVDGSPSPKTRKTATRRVNRLRSGELKRVSKNSPLYVPAITNFYNNLSVDNENLPSRCST